MSYVLGLDSGGTSTKAVLFDLQGREIAQAKENTRLITPAPGHTERDMEELWQCACAVIRKTLEKAHVPGEQIIGVSFSGHGKGLYLWGKDDKPARSGIVSTDTRAHAIVKAWEKAGICAAAREKTCQSVLACQPAALLKWLADNEPQVLDNIRYIFGVKDYLRFRMTGEAAAEITDLSGSNLLNLHTAAYDQELLELFGIGWAADKLPPPVYSAKFCGRVTAQCAAATGLAEGTPVAAGLFDIDACAVAMNVVNGDPLAVIAGTWSINEYIAPKPAGEGIKMNSLYCLPGWYLAEECSPTSASNLEWYLRSVLPDAQKPYETANRMAAEVSARDSDLVFLPYLFGSNDDGQARAAFVGLENRHDRSHMLRAVYEGVVFCHKVHIDRLLKCRPAPQSVRLAGGVVNSPLWVQMFADVLQLPVETVEVSEPGALGAAMTAAAAAGAYPDLQAAAEGMVHMGKTYMPDPAKAEIYREKYARYLAVADALANVWRNFRK